MFSVIFWDNDGVLMETEHLYFRANAEALARVDVELNLPTFQEMSLRRGESVLDLAHIASGEAEALRNWRDIRYRELLGEEAKPFPGVEEVLAAFHGEVPMAIVTSCRRENFLHMHRRSGLLGYFDFVLTREDYSNSKPDPEPYLTACERADFHPGACIAVEDSERGVRSAADAGLNVVAVPGDMNSDGDFSAARWRLERVGELLEIFRKG